jgi:hypothetical protein
MILKIYIENELIDLFADEAIELNSSVANTEDISKINTDYTKTFTVPASDNNNKIFKHYYNADIDNTFDARTKKNARIELGGLPFRTGKMRLEKVSVKHGKPSAYTINFWGNLVNFKNLIKDDELSALDLSEFDHSYTFSAVDTGLRTGLFDRDIIYTLMNQDRQYMYNSDVSDNTNTDKLVNIAFNGENRGVKWNELKPSIRIEAIIRAIENTYGFNFSDDFFSRTEFKELYLWLNNSDGVQYTEQEINWTSGDATEYGLNLSTDIWSVSQYISPISNMTFRVGVIPESGFDNVPYKIIAKNNGIVYMTQDAIGSSALEFSQAPDVPFNVKFYISSATAFQYSSDLTIRANVFGGTVDKSAFTGVEIITDVFKISEGVPKIKTIDFLKALFSMFKLVAIPDEFGNVYVNTIDEWYKEGNIYDISKYVEWDSYDVERGKIFSNINYKYQDPTTILNAQFKSNTGIAYGDELLVLADENGEPLDGETLDVPLPFENVLFERLTDIETNTLTNVQYGLITNENIESVNPKAVIFYNNRVSLSAGPVSLLNTVGDSISLDDKINTPAHTLGFDNPAFSILWGVEFSTWNGVAIDGTLYKNFWQNYIKSIFNIKKRNFKFKAILPTWILTKLKLNDVLFIKDRYYRLNDFTVELTKGDATLNLMNTFENNFGIFAPSQSRVFLTFVAQSYSVYVSNGTVMNFTKTDLGFGTSWATLTRSGNNMIITVTEWGGAEPRNIYITVDNGSGKSFEIYLSQSQS